MDSEILGLLCHVIVWNVEHRLLARLSLSRGREVVSHRNCPSAEWYVALIASHLGITTLPEEKGV